MRFLKGIRSLILTSLCVVYTVELEPCFSSETLTSHVKNDTEKSKVVVKTLLNNLHSGNRRELVQSISNGNIVVRGMDDKEKAKKAVVDYAIFLAQKTKNVSEIVARVASNPDGNLTISNVKKKENGKGYIVVMKVKMDNEDKLVKVEFDSSWKFIELNIEDVLKVFAEMKKQYLSYCNKLENRNSDSKSCETLNDFIAELNKKSDK